MTSKNCRTLYFALVLALPLVACGGNGGSGDDDDAAADSLCNGVQDVGEFTVDDTFDVDGDGFFDDSDPGCALNYEASQLDCNDDDPFVNPGATEIHCDGEDNDCDPATEEASDLDLDGITDCDGDCDDGRADTYPGAPEVECDGVDQDCDGLDAGDGCVHNYVGTWTLDSEVTYSCTGLDVGFVDFALGQSGQAVQVDTVNCAACNAPGSLQGEFNSESQMGASASFVMAGACTAVFDMLITFTGSESLTGTMSINFSGQECSSLGCSGQLLTFSGQKVD